MIPHHSRIRGEHAGTTVPKMTDMGSSPHSRGTLAVYCDRFHVAGIIPAFAGNTIHPVCSCCFTRDHPRIRGEHQCFLYGFVPVLGSSPHSRGTLSTASSIVVMIGIIPAFAGNTRTAERGRTAQWDHPRIRGEHGVCSGMDE